MSVCVVGRRQPEEQRKQARLDAKRDQKQDSQHRCQPIIYPPTADLPRQVGHVQRAGHAVEDADRGQEQGRRQQVDGDVLQRAFKLLALAAQGHQHKRRDQHHLEPDIQVEHIPGQKCATDTHQQRVQQGIVPKGFAVPVDAAQ